MSELYSVEQVAERLGLHVKTVRNYVRDGRLRAVRIGKQYRIAAEDLAALTGGPVPAAPREDARRTRHVEVSTVVAVDAVSRHDADRVTTLVTAAISGPRDGGEPIRVQAAYDEERARLRVMLLGGPQDTAELLRLIDAILQAR
ncbi:MerR family transcriptional regulator [Catellatospora sp. IY07-71]|uniref:helix-turn-helix domain-containing protein n=1 Tax=Catellatospora sp. IY07-71 TaxID=2728827 RepID=UPI001BB39406|nr:helix-turn-helix domain-containing protein [Catellatospora sp. IY07-71]BCJ75576.1 MerR family transcriptional regulator [Catellatospora sp. IY07-71]